MVSKETIYQRLGRLGLERSSIYSQLQDGNCGKYVCERNWLLSVSVRK